MNYLDEVQRGINFIEENLDFDISLQAVSQVSGISQWHFQRIFKALTNETLKTYIRSRRMANAYEKLLNTDDKIIDIAVTAGFESQESFSRAFKKAFDITPNAARKIGSNNLFLKKVTFDQEYLAHINQNVSLTPEIYTQRAMTFVGMKTQFYGIESEKNNLAVKLPELWDEFLPRMDDIDNRITELSYGLIQQGKEKDDRLEYYAAVEVSHIESLPEGMVSFCVPESSYAKFQHRGQPLTVNNTVNYIYSSWLLQSGKRHTYAPDMEIYGHEYIPDSDDCIIYYAIPIS